MKLKDLLLANWSQWSKGGLSEQVIAVELTGEELSILLVWFKEIFLIIDEVQPKLAVKSIVDIATWVIYGTDSLLFHSREMRKKELSDVAQLLEISVPALNQLIIASEKLREIVDAHD